MLLQSAPLPGSPGGRVDHFEGVAAALASHGLAADRSLAETGEGQELPAGTGVAAVADCLSPVCRRALFLARRAGVPTLLLMDGLVEWRNTFANPAAGRDFLRPAPVHSVACAGACDAETLRALGNARPVATGLPRLDALAARGALPMPGEATLLVATANTAWFDDAERVRLTRALASLRDAARRARVPTRWRVPPALAAELGVPADGGTLADALASCSAVMTTPSTLMVEAMLAGRPTGLLHCHPTPLWQPSAWCWRGPEACEAPRAAEWARASGVPEALLPNAEDAGDIALGRTLGSLLAPSGADLRRQDEALTLLTRGDGGAARRVAEELALLARTPPRERPPEAPAWHRVAEPLPRDAGKGERRRPRLVSMVLTDGAPLGGVPVWCQRLAAHAAREPSLGLDARTLYVTTSPFALSEEERGLAEVCVVDPGRGVWHALETARASLAALEPDAICPHYGDLCHAAAALLRAHGVRTIGVMHTADEATERVLATYPIFDGVVGVSQACGRTLARLFPGVPREVAACGVPVAARPRVVGREGPLRLAYVGRMARLQKRVDLLAVLARELSARGVPAELHLVGDGPDLAGLLAEWQRDEPAGIALRVHGRRSAAEVTGLLEMIDCTVLVSEFEGTSMTMLEAMGAGVVPVVTDVGSGAQEHVIDGVTGVLVGVGDVRAMADRLAGLHADRTRLAAMGVAAWEHARACAGVDRPAAVYAAMVRRVLDAPMTPWPADAGLRVAEPWRWRSHTPWEPEEAAAWIAARLAEAGAADALIERGEATPEACERVATARAAGRPAVLSPGLIEPEWARLAGAVRGLEREGCARVVVVGAGDHTRRAARAFARGLPIVGIADDAPRESELFGVPVVRIADAAGVLRPDAAVLSSDAWEAALWRAAEPLRRAGVRVKPLYGRYE